MDFSKIKLIIWDLDDSFWSGTLSEGAVSAIQSNIEIVKNLTKQGVVHSVCSKNDKVSAEMCLKEIGVDDCFVFNSIDWTPKGQRIKQTLEDMGLRAVNTLFIDDNIVNINEAKYYVDGILTLNPLTHEGQHSLNELLEFSRQMPFKDEKMKRLAQYRILEQKREAKNKASDNLQFLYSTNTQVSIHKDCLNQLDRIAELVMRTNQLNFTKKRMEKIELKALLEDPSVDSGYVTVRDNFGDYGVVGFFAIKEGVAIHFLFSCRTIGQGIEQWVYSTINYPSIEVIGETISKLEYVEAPAWINQQISNNSNTDGNILRLQGLGEIVFKGPCDLEMLTSYLSLEPQQVTTEFTYVSEDNRGSIEHQNHTTNILSFATLSDKEKEQLIEECYFNDIKVFESKIFNKNTACVFLSTFVDPQLAVYQRKEDGYRIAFGDYNCDITDRRNWNNIINNKFLGFMPSEADLERFANKFEYVGQLSVDETIENLKRIFSKLSTDTYLCLTLGSEIMNTKNTLPSLENRELYNKTINEKLRKWAAEEKRVWLLDFNDFISSDSDYLDTINHFQRKIYYKAAMQLNDYISIILGRRLKKKNSIVLWYRKVFRPTMIRWLNSLLIFSNLLQYKRQMTLKKRYGKK